MTRPERAEDVWGGHFVHRLDSPRKTDLPPLQGGRVSKPRPGVETPGLVLLPPFGAEPNVPLRRERVPTAQSSKQIHLHRLPGLLAFPTSGLFFQAPALSLQLNQLDPQAILFFIKISGNPA